MNTKEAREQAKSALVQAQKASRRGNLAEAERWSKTAERIAGAAERLAASADPAEEEDEESIRAEIRARIMRLVEAQRDLEAWNEERAAYDQAVARAMSDGSPLPPPPRPCPGGMEYIEAMARGEID